MAEQKATNDLKELKRAAQPVFLTSSLFGIGIIEFPVGKQHRILSYFYAAFIFIFYIFAAIYSVPYLLEFGRYILANQTFVKGFFGSHIFLTVSSIIIGWHRNERSRSILGHILSTDETLKKIGLDPNYRQVFKSEVWNTTMLILIICIFTALINFTLLYGAPVTIEKITFLIVLDFPTILISIGDTNFLTIIHYSKIKLKKLNNLLEKKMTSTCDCPQHKSLLKCLQTPSKAPPHSIDLSTDIMDDDLYTINIARIGHLNLVKFCNAANEIFAYHILISMAVAVLTLTGCFYHTYALLTLEGFKISNYWIFALMSSVVAYHTLRILLFTKYCSELSEASTDTGDIIAEMYDENISEECKMGIRQFEKQLIVRPLRIHVLYTTIDYSFVQKTIATVATYLIILTQCGNLTVEIPEK